MTYPDGEYGSETLGPDPEPLQVIKVLSAKLDRQKSDLDTYDAYFRGKQSIAYIPEEVQTQIGDRLRNVIMNLPRLAIETLEETLDVTGFRLPGQDTGDDDLWQLWEAAGFTSSASRLHLRILKHGRAFTTVWNSPQDRMVPSLKIESARQVAVDLDPDTGDVRSGLKLWQDGKTRYATVMLSQEVVRYEKTSETEWTLRKGGIVKNPLGVPPVVPYLNRWDEDAPDGESDLVDIIPFGDAISKLATDMMVTSEFHAMPRRWATGIQVPDGDNAERVQEQAQAYWDKATAGRTWLAGKGVEFGQFAAAELGNFVVGMKQLLLMAAATASLPPHYVGMTTDNPASADAIRSARAGLNKRSGRRAMSIGGGHVNMICLAVRIRDGNDAKPMTELQTLWADPGVPTLAETADAAIKLVSSDIIDVEQAQEDIGYSPTQRKAMADRREAALKGQYDSETEARVRAALAMMDEQGMSAQVAFAAQGLLTLAHAPKPGLNTPPSPEGDPIAGAA